MKTIKLKKGLDLPISGEPEQAVEKGNKITRVALTGDDFIGMKPTMSVSEGDHVKTGQLLFRDKRNEGVIFTSPATGKVVGINRGAKRKFETVVIEVEDDDFVHFLDPTAKKLGKLTADEMRNILVQSGMWTGFRTRPYGKVPQISATPASLFVTMMDTRPLAADPLVIYEEEKRDFSLGLQLLDKLVECSKYLCCQDGFPLQELSLGSFEMVEFQGPHPAGLASTHIHFLAPVMESKMAWHIDYQDVIGIGHLFRTGHLPTEKIIALGGPGVVKPVLQRVRIGADIQEVCSAKIISTPVRVISGSVLDGRQVQDHHQFLGRYHNQVAVLHEQSGRAPFSWASPGQGRHSVKNIFTSAINRARKLSMNTALWGGKRAIYPIDSYARVMPLDMEPLTLLKAIASGNTEKAAMLGALELIEDDVALLSYVCPGKNDFGPMLRDLLTEIESGG